MIFVWQPQNTLARLKAEVLAVNGGGWCEARMLDGDFCGWLCPHVHTTPQEAEDCPHQDGLLGPQPSLGTQDCREPDINWRTGRPRPAPKLGHPRRQTRTLRP